MKLRMKLLWGVFLILWLSASAFGCTGVVVGRKASADGSVITSHTADGAFYDARVRVIPGRVHKPGEMAPVYWNITNEEYGPPVKIGEIPQAERTYSYFHVGYPFMNEWGLTMGESTVSQKMEMKTFRPDARAIMTVEQLEVFALQRAKTAREAIEVMGALAEKYGFVGSCSFEGESLTIADKKEAWVFELRSAGIMWTPESGRPGAYWAAQRVPDDMAVVVCNVSRIQEINPNDKDNFMVSRDYKQFAIDMGWWNPRGSEPFNWSKVYAPYTGGWALSSDWVRNRLYTLYKRIDPNREWDPLAETTSYPFAVKPAKKLSVQDVQSLLRSHMEDSIFDMYEAEQWYVREGNKAVKSPLASPFPTRDERALLKIPYNRPVAKWDCAYSFVAQVRDGLPKPLTTILWFGYDNPHTTCYVPIYNGALQTLPSWQVFDRNEFSLDSAQWAFILADDLVLRRYGDAMQDLLALRGPLEEKFARETAEIDREGAELFKSNPAAVERLVTDFTWECMERAEKQWRKLNGILIMKYNNNKKS